MQRVKDEEVEATKSFVFSPEGESHIRNTILKDWHNLQGKPYDPTEEFGRVQRKRLQREYQRLHPEESED